LPRFVSSIEAARWNWTRALLTMPDSQNREPNPHDTDATDGCSVPSFASKIRCTWARSVSRPTS
jgi:hypothetical protein